jgi:hypothetical protein
MEDLFAPTTRFRDLHRAIRELDHMQHLVELELITGSSAEDTFLHRRFTLSDFYSLACGKIVWISPDVFFEFYPGICMDFQNDYLSFLEVDIVPNEEDTRQQTISLRVCARSEAHATIASDILFQLLTTCDSRKVVLGEGRDSNHFPVSGLAFSHFLAQSRNLRVLTLHSLGLDTCHCRAIDTLTRTDLQIELVDCLPTESGEDIILECIRQNRGPTKLISCRMDARRLAGALRGNSIVTILIQREDCSDEDKLVLVQALAENEGLVRLDLSSRNISDEIWTALWRSVARHPKLESLAFLSPYDITWRHGNTDAQKTLRTQVMVDTLRVNTVMHTVRLSRREFDEGILDSTVYPLLLTNKYRPRVGAIAEVEGPLRHKLLWRALASISSKPSLLWMFLSGNANVRFGPPPAEEREGA